jgi:lipopolysaccharide transport system ATP-binding protein
LEPEILLVDEVLAVGDASFQAKCLGRMREVANEGRTVLFVSHNINAVAKLTNRAVCLRHGRRLALGSTSEVIKLYLETNGPLISNWVRPAAQLNNSDVEFTAVRCRECSGNNSARFWAGEPFILEFDFKVRQELDAQIAFRLNSSVDASTVLTSALSDRDELKATRLKPGEYRGQCFVPKHLLVPGKYHLLVAANRPNGSPFDLVNSVLEFEISSVGSLTAIDGRWGVVAPSLNWELAQLAASFGTT